MKPLMLAMHANVRAPTRWGNPQIILTTGFRARVRRNRRDFGTTKHTLRRTFSPNHFEPLIFTDFH
jgi:hypothetical protein